MENVNETYRYLEDASAKIQEFLDDNQITSADIDLMLKLEELNDKMYELDLEDIKSQSDNLMQFDNEIKEIKQNAQKVLEKIDAADDFIDSATKVVSLIDKILTQINKLRA